MPKKLAMNNPFYVIQDPQGEGLCWANTDDKDDAWEIFNGFDKEHGIVDWSEWDADQDKGGERWETTDEFLKEQGCRCIPAKLYEEE